MAMTERDRQHLRDQADATAAELVDLRHQLAEAEADRDALTAGTVRLVLLSELCECPDVADGGSGVPGCPTHGDPDVFVARVRYLREVEQVARVVVADQSLFGHSTVVELAVVVNGGA